MLMRSFIVMINRCWKYIFTCKILMLIAFYFHMVGEGKARMRVGKNNDDLCYMLTWLSIKSFCGLKEMITEISCVH